MHQHKCDELSIWVLQWADSEFIFNVRQSQNLSVFFSEKEDTSMQFKPGLLALKNI